ncbi:MAG: alpha-L-fucosidase [Bacteroidales bacterium]|nr:alpha-L-fucosidase [Bacteroidales bacterium]
MRVRDVLFAAFGALVLAACAPKVPHPSFRQYAWQDLEYYMFCHFGPNTFTNLEWGHGDEDPGVFNPSDLDCRQWARIAKAAGMKGIIITAKHHDGFCLWPSGYSSHTVAQSSWKGGKGDVLRELEQACREEGILFGVYISPWDRNHPTYGTVEYNKVYADMLREVHSGYGPIFEQWFDGACGEGPNGKKQVYDWKLFHKVVRELSPNAVMFSDIGPDVRWIGNELGYVGETNWCRLDTAGFTPGAGAPSFEHLNCGDRDGEAWIPGEVDVSIRPGWFYSPDTDDKVKTVPELMEIWFSSVGRGANLLLNVPPDRRGKIHPADSARLMDFKNERDRLFAIDLVSGASIKRSRSKGSVILDAVWPSPVKVSVVELREDLLQGQFVEGFEVVSVSDNGTESLVCSGTTIGHKRLLRLPEPVETSHVCIRARTIIRSKISVSLY